MDLASVDPKSPKNMALTASIAFNNFLVWGIRKKNNLLYSLFIWLFETGSFAFQVTPKLSMWPRMTLNF